MHRKTLLAICAVLVSAAFVAYAGSMVTVPNTFVAGTPAKASDVNANFTAVVNGINAHGQSIATLQTNVQSLQNAQSGATTPMIVKDSAGHIVGPYIPMLPNSIAAPPLNEGVFIRTSAASFALMLTNQSLGGGGALWYTTSDCTGTAYVVPSGTWSSEQTLNYAAVINNTAYVFHWSGFTSVSLASEQTFNGTSLQCAPQTATTTGALPVVASVDLSALGFVPPFSVQ
jgi:hypothetical protein